MEREKLKEIRNGWAIVSAFGFLAVSLGAFGAHALAARLDSRLLDIYHTAVTYQFYHAFAMAVTLYLYHKSPAPKLKWAFWFFVCGTMVFSGSLYSYVLTQIKTFGMITPIGGICFLIGWGLIFFNQLSWTKTSR